jgi:hypothetical protein
MIRLPSSLRALRSVRAIPVLRGHITSKAYTPQPSSQSAKSFTRRALPLASSFSFILLGFVASNAYNKQDDSLAEDSVDVDPEVIDVRVTDERAKKTQFESPISRANRILRNSERSIALDGVRVDTCGVPSNSIDGEDRCTVAEVSWELPNGNQENLFCWAIYDGHAGDATARVLQSTLHDYVFTNVSKLYTEAVSTEAGTRPGSREIEQAIRTSFVMMDETIMKQAEEHLKDPSFPPASAQVINSLAPALSGSCALLSLFEPSTSTLRVACVGDSRAVSRECASL